MAISYCSDIQMCAMHLFSVFMVAVAGKIKGIGGETTLEDKTTADLQLKGHFRLKLQNSVLEEMSEALQQTGFCNKHEALVSTIAALHTVGKMPKDDLVLRSVGALLLFKFPKLTNEAVHSWAAEKALPYELNEEFDEAGKIYLWLFRVYQCMGPDNDSAVQAIAMLQEFSRRVDKAHHLRGQLHKAMENDSTDQQLKKLNTELESANTFCKDSEDSAISGS